MARDIIVIVVVRLCLVCVYSSYREDERARTAGDYGPRRRLIQAEE